MAGARMSEAIDVAGPSLVLFAGYAVLVARAQPWPATRTVAFAAGLVLVAAGALMPEHPLPLHMAGHAAIVAAGAPLMILGRPVTLLLRGLPRPAARDFAGLLRRPWLRALLWPPLAWVAFVAAQSAFHLTPLFYRALEDETLHALEHVLFLATALWLWSVCLAVEPLPGRWGPWGRAALLMAAMSASDVGAVKLMLDGDAAAGAAMAVGMMPLGLGAVAVVWGELMREERAARRAEAEPAPEVLHAAG
jgi:putative membrane protein